MVKARLQKNATRTIDNLIHLPFKLCSRGNSHQLRFSNRSNLNLPPRLVVTANMLRSHSLGRWTSLSILCLLVLPIGVVAQISFGAIDEATTTQTVVGMLT